MKTKSFLNYIGFSHIFIAFLLSGFISCKKFIEVSPPKTQLTTATVFQDDQTANSAVAGLYSNMYHLNSVESTFGGLQLTINPGLTADELYKPASPTNPYFQNSIPSSDGDISQAWQGFYTTIYDANSILEGLQASSTLSSSMKNQLSGEALFVRAFCHFYLVNIFGDIPLIITTNVDETSSVPRSPASTIYKQVVADLLQAQNLLETDYSFSKAERVRANKWAATALLAKVYLYTGDWTNAEIQSGSVINQTSLYSLITDLNTVFLQNSSEAIWQFLTYGGAGYTTLGVELLPNDPTTVPSYAISNWLLNAFEPNDLRKSSWLNSYLINGQTYYVPFKYKQGMATDANGEYDMVLRLSEQYLIRAEARAELGKIDEAASDINIIRQRAGLSDVTVTDKSSVLLAVEHERQCELFTEWGHRWLDLKRTGRISEVLGAEKPSWKNSAALFPIPQVELSKNPALTQNPGY
jgi:hypothetical protein